MHKVVNTNMLLNPKSYLNISWPGYIDITHPADYRPDRFFGAPNVIAGSLVFRNTVLLLYLLCSLWRIKSFAVAV